MAEKQAYMRKKTHFDNDGDVIPEWGEGVDSFTVKIPVGSKYSRYAIQKLDGSTPLSDAKVIKTTKKDGEVSLKVRWNYPIFGKIEYALRVYTLDKAEKVQPVTVHFGAANWYETAMQLVEQGRSFRIQLVGDEARDFWRLIAGGKASIAGLNPSVVEGAEAEKLGYIPNPVYTAKADGGITLGITIAVCMTIIAVTSFVFLGIVLLEAVNKGCDSKATNNGNLIDAFFSTDIDVSCS